MKLKPYEDNKENRMASKFNELDFGFCIY